MRANYLASPPLVVAYALAGTMDIDLTQEPLGQGKDGKPVYLKDVWPSSREVQAAIAASVQADMFRKTYAEVFTGDERWRAIDVPKGRDVRVGRTLDLRQASAVLRRHAR